MRTICDDERNQYKVRVQMIENRKFHFRGNANDFDKMEIVILEPKLLFLKSLHFLWAIRMLNASHS